MHLCINLYFFCWPNKGATRKRQVSTIITTPVPLKTISANEPDCGYP